MKAAFVYLLVSLCFIGLVLYSNQPHRLKSKVHRNLHPGRRIVVRKLHISRDAKHANVAFDPVVADLERKRENRAWEKEHFEKQHKEWAKDSTTGHAHDAAPHPESQPEPTDWDYKDPEEYLNDEDQFNVSSRILTLFPLIDNHPPDGRISLAELQDWHLQAALTEADHRAAREMETYDKNHDSLISFAEYLPHSTSEDPTNHSMNHGGVGWWKEQFDAADEDGDAFLNATEFNNFLHPQDSHSRKLHQWLRKQEIRDRDHDNDDKLNFLEFEQGVYDLIKLHDEEQLSASSSNLDHSAKREAHAKHKFSELDKNKDGFLTEDELVPIMDSLHPGEAYYAKQQAEYLISQADKNKDGHLTIEEMLENPYIFYSTAYAYEDYEEYIHDEF
ncbi:hypothetical protein GOP47_0012279 [Adiantum capillus-veneris]|uniref:EF-hand domain-containing protein n=1 Tax=Adiantum capillus-veneris TaxID=13818 RepID=A0A9D4ZE59_ADICA|nr:hypothetical protein GOP47_0012279 [Adiantum capillus-veneris]